MIRTLLSRLALCWAALAVGLALLLPAPLGAWVAALAVAAAAMSMFVGRAAQPRTTRLDPAPATVVEEVSLLDTAAMVVRHAAHAHDLPAALHGVARVLVQQLGADGLLTGLLDHAGVPQSLDRFDASATRAGGDRAPMSTLAADALRSRRVTGSAATGFAVPVLRRGAPAAWLQFKRLDLAIAPQALLKLLELVRAELSDVADRSPPAPRPLLTRYPLRRSMVGGVAGPDDADVVDPSVLDRLRDIDPNGVSRLLERVVKAFEASLTRLLPQLREAARRGNVGRLQHLASALRSASVSVGAVTLAQWCDDIDAQAAADDADALVLRVQALSDEVELVLSILRGLTGARA